MSTTVTNGEGATNSEAVMHVSHRPLPPTVFDFAADSPSTTSVVSCLTERGFVVLRGLFPQETINDLLQRANFFLEKPAAGGSKGYQVVDFPRKVVNPATIVGGRILEIILDEQVLEIIQNAMQGDCVLAETGLKLDKGVGYEYFPLHCDFGEGVTRGTNLPLTRDDLEHVIAVAALLYLHDTREGAFCYLDGSHKLRSPRGTEFRDYPPEEREALLTRHVRIDAQKGDLVLFDLRGFHGPEQPSRASRLVLISHYYRIKTFGYIQVSPLPVWTSDLGDLTPEQRRVLGLGATPMIPSENYIGNRIRGTSAYYLATRLLSNAFIFAHFKRKLKQWWPICAVLELLGNRREGKPRQ